jgi:hypothetical protein
MPERAAAITDPFRPRNAHPNVEACSTPPGSVFVSDAETTAPVGHHRHGKTASV